MFGLSMRLTGPLAIMPSADQVPIKSSHSRMLWPKWVVLITGSTGSELRAVGPFQPFHHVVAGAISSNVALSGQCDGFPVALACHHGPGHARDLVCKRDRSDFRRSTHGRCLVPWILA